jgi:hypothetical protein
MAKKRYLEDYEIEISLDKKGNEKKTLKYCGPHYDISFSGPPYQVYKRISFILFAGLVIFHVTSGFAANQGMYQIYVALPYAIAFLTLTFLGFGLFTLPKDHIKIQRDVMEQSFKRIKVYSAITLGLLVIVILGETTYFLTHSANAQVIIELIFLLLELISALFVFGLFRLQENIHIQKSEE